MFYGKKSKTNFPTYGDFPLHVITQEGWLYDFLTLFMVLTAPGIHGAVLVRAKDLYFVASSNSVQRPSPRNPWTVHGGLDHQKIILKSTCLRLICSFDAWPKNIWDISLHWFRFSSKYEVTQKQTETTRYMVTDLKKIGQYGDRTRDIRVISTTL